MINVGAYTAGSDLILDQTIQLYPHFQQFLRQDCDQYCSRETSLKQLCQLFPATSSENPSEEP